MAKTVTISQIVRAHVEQVRLKPVSRGRETGLPQKEARNLLIRWTIRSWFITQALGPERLTYLQTRVAELEDAYQLSHLIRILLHNGLFEPSPLARSRVAKLVGRIDTYTSSIEPAKWLDDDVATELHAIQIPPEFWVDVIEAGVPDPHPLLPRLGSVSSDAVFRTASKGEAILRAADLVLAGAIEPWAQISYEPENEFLSLEFPPEGLRREYKATFRADTKSGQKNPHQQRQCLRAIASFLNMEGGTLICGIDDARQVIGLDADFALIKGQDKEDFLIQIVHEAIKQNLKPWPVGLVGVDVVPTERGSVAVIEVQKSPQPIELEGEVLIRDGNRTVRLTNP